MRAAWAVLAGLSSIAVLSSQASAEPYLAVQSGFKCAVCHTNPSGGGKRTAFGSGYARSALSARIVSSSDGDDAWTGEVNRWLAVGGDLRAGVEHVDVPDGNDAQSEFEVSQGTVYAELRAIPELLTFYLDQQVAPGGSLNREAYALITPAGGRYTVKAGKFFLPFGLRLQDDTAFVRQRTGISFDTPDNGVELGLELDRWSAQLAVTNGTAGGPENDSGKQLSFRASRIMPGWRIGASYNVNDAELGDRTMHGVFAGLRTGPIAWLAELDVITDEIAGGERDSTAGLLEGNWRVADGHNVKLSYERFDPDTDQDDDVRERLSLVWEYWAMQHFQSRLGIRAHDGVPGLALTNRDELFAELHIYF